MKKITFILFATLFFISQTKAQFTVNKIDGTAFTNNEIINFTLNDLKIVGCRVERLTKGCRKLFMPKFIPKFYCYQICMLRGYALKSKELHCVQHGVQTWTR